MELPLTPGCSLKELSVSEKQKIARLINEVVRLGNERQQLQSQLDTERNAFRVKSEKLRKQNQDIIDETVSLRGKYSRSLQLIRDRQQEIAQLKEEMLEQSMQSAVQTTVSALKPVLVDESTQCVSRITSCRDSVTQTDSFQVQKQQLYEQLLQQEQQQQRRPVSLNTVGVQTVSPSVAEPLTEVRNSFDTAVPSADPPLSSTYLQYDTSLLDILSEIESSPAGNPELTSVRSSLNSVELGIQDDDAVHYDSGSDLVVYRERRKRETKYSADRSQQSKEDQELVALLSSLAAATNYYERPVSRRNERSSSQTRR